MLETYFPLFPSCGHGSTLVEREERVGMQIAKFWFCECLRAYYLTLFKKKSSLLATDTVQMKRTLHEMKRSTRVGGLSRYSERAVVSVILIVFRTICFLISRCILI